MRKHVSPGHCGHVLLLLLQVRPGASGGLRSSGIIFDAYNSFEILFLFKGNAVILHLGKKHYLKSGLFMINRD